MNRDAEDDGRYDPAESLSIHVEDSSLPNCQGNGAVGSFAGEYWGMSEAWVTSLTRSQSRQRYAGGVAVCSSG
jgi:hypothetical protein